MTAPTSGRFRFLAAAKTASALRRTATTTSQTPHRAKPLEFVDDEVRIRGFIFERDEQRRSEAARLSLHHDKNERDFANPIVSISLGLPATFQFGGLKRADPAEKYVLRHGDVAVWGGPSRLC
jgi:alkylated DNA repair dioxygenase AlkB